MNRLTIYIIYIAITNISCGSLTRNVAMTSVKHELQRKQVQQTGDILDLRYVSRNFKPGKFHSSDTLFYDPVFENHSVLADFLNKKEVKVNSEMELKLRQKIKCTGLCETSLCPWDVEINKDEERTPKNIAKARCRSKFCDFDFTGMSKWSKFKMKMDTCCESVYTDIFAIINGTEVWLEWPIACICVRRRSRLFGTSSKSARAIEMTNLKTQSQVKDEIQAKKERDIAFKMKTNKEQISYMFHNVTGKAVNGNIEPENNRS